MDSMAAIALFSQEDEVTHQHGLEVLDFRELRSPAWSISIRHIYGKVNHATDHLAGRGFSFPLGCHVIPNSDCNLGYFLRYYSLGISESRNIIINA
ncbi:hypothetical protein LINPERPRIM_LOCUS438 [Linum perenne]